jgi:hypothetical protein
MRNHNESLCRVAISLKRTGYKMMGRKGAGSGIDPINVRKRFR